MLYGLKGNLASLAANLDFGFRQGGHNKTVLACASSFGHFLNEGDEVVETSRWQALHTVDFLGVGHKLVHKDKAGTAGVKGTLECLGSGRNTLLVRFLHVVVQLQIPNGQGQLSRHLAPDCVDGDARHVLQLLAVPTRTAVWTVGMLHTPAASKIERTAGIFSSSTLPRRR